MSDDEIIFYTYKEIQDVLEGIVHDLEPAGIGARNFKESIYLQLQRKNLNPANRIELANTFQSKIIYILRMQGCISDDLC